jgi:hypothetical protein
LGGLTPVAVAGGSAALRGASDFVGGGLDAALGRASQSRANRAIAETLRRAGLTMDDVSDDVARAAQQGQPEFRLMDAMGQAGQRRASGIVRAGDDGAEELANFLRQRQLDQPSRVSGFVEDAFDMQGMTAAQKQAALTEARRTAADAAYGAARGNAAPVDVRGALGVIDGRIGGMQGSGVTGDGIDAALSRFRSRLAAQPGGKAFPGASSVELSDFDRVLSVKQDVQDAIGSAVRAGRNNEARELGKLATALDQALEGASDGYRAANDGFRQASQVIGAVDDGAAMARPGARAADTVQQFQAMTPEQQAAARVGYGDRALAQIERNPAPNSNAMRGFNSTKAREEAAAMATDPQLFDARRTRENTMWETMNRALGGSRTADNLQDIGGVGLMADLGRAARGGIGGMADLALNAASRAGNVATGQNAETRALIAQMLMSPDAAKALLPAVRQETSAQARRKLIEAMLLGNIGNASTGLQSQ